MRYGPIIEAGPQSYLDFVRAKAVSAPELGLPCDVAEVHPLLHRHQPVLVKWLVESDSNPGDLVYDPFGGLMTVPLRAVLKGRRGMGVELNPGYFEDGVRILRDADRDRATPSLFDLIEAEEVPEIIPAISHDAFGAEGIAA